MVIGKRFWPVLMLAGGMLFSGCKTPTQQPKPEEASEIQSQSSKKWVMGYLPSWLYSKLPPEKIDFQAITHLAHFALVPAKTGGFVKAESVTPEQSQKIVAAAKKHGVKVLISIGGWDTATGFRYSTNSQRLDKFTNDIIDYMKKYGYDGVDLDWEPVAKGDEAQYLALAKMLRTKLNKISPRPLLTAATQWEFPIFAKMAPHLDMLNLMTYDLVGPYQGYKTWHHTALYGKHKVLNRSANADVDACLKLGIPASKLGIGIGLYGWLWPQVTKPGDAWKTSKVKKPTYADIMEKHAKEGSIKWDNEASAPYISVDKPGTANDYFLSFDNAESAKLKLNYIKSRNLGGAIIWPLGNDVMKDGSQPMMQAIKKAR